MPKTKTKSELFDDDYLSQFYNKIMTGPKKFPDKLFIHISSIEEAFNGIKFICF